MRGSQAISNLFGDAFSGGLCDGTSLQELAVREAMAAFVIAMCVPLTFAHGQVAERNARGRGKAEFCSIHVFQTRLNNLELLQHVLFNSNKLHMQPNRLKTNTMLLSVSPSVKEMPSAELF
jgi:hypothetical protein